jgi:hypothetical protein
LDADAFSTSIAKPTKKWRLSTFSVYVKTWFNCSETYQPVYKWSLSQVDSADKVISSIDLSGHESASTPQLTIAAFWLDYGIYRFTYNATMIITNQTTPVSTTVDASLNIYVQIEATSLSLFGLPNGVNYVQLGSKQSITLAPRLYSYDLDGVIPIDLLTLKYYCKSKGITFYYYREDPIDNSTGKPFDLKTLAMTSNVHKSTACFIETSKFVYLI